MEFMESEITLPTPRVLSDNPSRDIKLSQLWRRAQGRIILATADKVQRDMSKKDVPEMVTTVHTSMKLALAWVDTVNLLTLNGQV